MCGSLQLPLACLVGGVAAALVLPDLIDEYVDSDYAGIAASAALGALVTWSEDRSPARIIQGGFWGAAGWHVTRHLWRNGLS